MSIQGTFNSLNVGNNIVNQLSTLNVDGDLSITSGKYISFGTANNSNGYGIRDNDGVLEFKNSSG